MNHLIKLPRNANSLTIVNQEAWLPDEPFTVFLTTLDALRAGSTAPLCVVVYPAGNPAAEPEVTNLKL